MYNILVLLIFLPSHFILLWDCSNGIVNLVRAGLDLSRLREFWMVGMLTPRTKPGVKDYRLERSERLIGSG